ncbi:hypothetical protein LTR09_011261 [Extremus antarcticus]|uniref:Uncharacterized protein n=1 Tax=Extremus antarcticus TaxID=702011 RepID=A0AAJ0DC06_9PEZI|nr:hypothetical protein LTR09_011261 [Extremus antarcticus]
MTPLYDFRSITTVDIPACFKIAALSMQDDKQNQFKAACRDDPYDHEEGMRGALQHWTKPGSRSQTVLATDRNSGAVVGWMVWNYHEPKPEIPVAELEPVSEQEGQKTQQARSSKARLEAYSSSEMQKWMKVLTPAKELARCS